MKAAFVNLVLVVLSALIGLASAEAIARYFALVKIPQGVPGLSGYAAFIDNDEGKFFTSTNRYGYRTLDLTPADLGQRRAIVIIGDSHAHGIGVNDADRISELLQTSLDPQQKQLVVLNLAMAGAELRTYAHMSDFAAQFYPVAVLFILYSGNDVVETQFPRSGAKSKVVHVLAGYLRQLHIYHLAAQTWGGLRERKFSAGHVPCQIASDENVFGAFLQQLRQSCHFLRDHASTWEAAADHNVANFLQHVEQAGVPAFYFVLPSKLLVEEAKARPTFDMTTSRLGLDAQDAERISVAAHQKLVRALQENAKCRTSQPCVVDLLPFLAGASSDPYYFRRDWHLDRDGHAALRDIVLPILKAELVRRVEAGAK